MSSNIKEVGIIYEGIPVVCQLADNFNSHTHEGLRTGLFDAIQTFFRCEYSEPLNILLGKKIRIFFLKRCFNKNDFILGYVVFKKNKIPIEEYSNKIILPRLKETLKKFTQKYKRCNLFDVFQFVDFKKDIKTIFLMKE